MTKTRGSRRISSRSARFRASRYVITAISRLLVDVGEEPFARWLRRGVGERHGLVDAVVDVLFDRPHVGLREEARGEKLVAEQHDRIRSEEHTSELQSL